MRNRQRKVEKESFSPVPFPSLGKVGRGGGEEGEKEGTTGLSRPCVTQDARGLTRRVLIRLQRVCR